MNLFNPLFVLLIFIIVSFFAFIINSKFTITHISDNNRFESFDGIRGILSVLIFIYHSIIWYNYLHNGVWGAPSSAFHIQIGISSLSFFFIISGFLFMNKLLENKQRIFNWKRYFAGRFFRLVPMYFFSLLLIVFTVFYLTDWQLETTLLTFIKNISNWLLFCVLDNSTINNYQFTNFINAGVVWSLSYEWMLYFALPIVSIFILDHKPKWIYLLVSTLFIILTVSSKHYDLFYVFSIVGGMLTSLVYQKFKINVNTNSKKYSIILFILIFIVFQSKLSKSTLNQILLLLIFNIIVYGNDFFGLFKITVLKFIGEISYSLYLLHGIILFFVINILLGEDIVKSFTQQEYAYLIMLISPLIIIVSFITYFFIERSSMRVFKKMNKNKK